MLIDLDITKDGELIELYVNGYYLCSTEIKNISNEAYEQLHLEKEEYQKDNSQFGMGA